jgi:hypothetical protein
MKIVINKCYGGFGLTKAVFDELGIKYDGYGYINNEDMGIQCDDYMAYRASPKLIEAIEKVGIKESTAPLAKLAIIEIPDDVDWEIDEYDGIETIHEKHRSW